MLSKSEINEIEAVWDVDIGPVRRRLAKARLQAFRARRKESVRRAKGLPMLDAEPPVLVLPEVTDGGTMREALLLLAEWSRDGRVSWSRSIEEERKLDAEYLRAVKLEVERLCCRPKVVDR